MWTGETRQSGRKDAARSGSGIVTERAWECLTRKRRRWARRRALLTWVRRVRGFASRRLAKRGGPVTVHSSRRSLKREHPTHDGWDRDRRVGGAPALAGGVRSGAQDPRGGGTGRHPHAHRDRLARDCKRAAPALTRRTRSASAVRRLFVGMLTRMVRASRRTRTPECSASYDSVTDGGPSPQGVVRPTHPRGDAPVRARRPNRRGSAGHSRC